MDDRSCVAGSMEAAPDRDALTGLPGRAALAGRLERWIDRSRNEGTAVGLLRIDIAGFHRLNEYYGDDCGDRVLQVMADRLRDRLRPDDLLVRSGGNEFAVAMPLADSFNSVALENFADTLRRDGIEWAINLDGVPVYCPLSIGVARWPNDAATCEELLHRSGLALRLAKEGAGCDALRGAGRDDAHATSRERLHLEALWRAVHHGDNRSLAYQPQVDPRSGRVVGVEALLRIGHPGDGRALPTERVVALAERMDLVGALDRRSLTEAVAAMRDFVLGADDRRLAVNVSPRTLDADLPAFVRDVLCSAAFPAARLELELTETGMVSSDATPERTDILAELADIGVRLIIDDFGAGHAGFSRLRSAPAAGFKTDRSIIAGYGLRCPDTELIELFAQIGERLDYTIIVEGVECGVHMEAARRLGYTRAQGWYIAPALSLAAFDEFLLNEPIDGGETPDTIANSTSA